MDKGKWEITRSTTDITYRYSKVNGSSESIEIYFTLLPGNSFNVLTKVTDLSGFVNADKYNPVQRVSVGSGAFMIKENKKFKKLCNKHSNMDLIAKEIEKRFLEENDNFEETSKGLWELKGW